MENILHIQTKNVYGNTLVYPACDKTRLFASLLRKKTFDAFDVETLQKLGYSFEIVNLKQTITNIFKNV